MKAKSRHVELSGDVQHLLQFLRRRLVRQRRRWPDPDLRRLAQASSGLQPRSTSEPGRVQRQPPRHGIHQGHLEVERGLVTGDPVLAEPLQHRADILVLELDGPLGPVVQQREECAAMLGLAVAAPGDVVGQHREVICDDQVVLFICPRPVRHCTRLWARSLFVIRDFRQGFRDMRGSW
jgi:hypothetical protein